MTDNHVSRPKETMLEQIAPALNVTTNVATFKKFRAANLLQIASRSKPA